MVRVAVVGAGVVAQRHVQALRTLENAKIVGVVDLALDRARALASPCGAEACRSLSECLDRVDLVHILTPPSTHRDIAIQAMRAGKDVVCEKPISISTSDARAMIETAGETGRRLFVAFKSRYRKGYRMLKQAVESPGFGTLINFWVQRLGGGAGLSTKYDWRTDPKLLCGMTIESLSHDIDIIRWIAGDVIDVRANMFESRADIPGFDDNANIVMSLAGGGTALIHASWSSYIGMSCRGVLGSKGTAYLDGPGLFDLKCFHLKTADMEDESIQVINDYNDVTAFIKENKDFIASIEAGTAPSITGEDGLKSLQISQAALLSNRERRVVAPDELAML